MSQDPGENETTSEESDRSVRGVSEDTPARGETPAESAGSAGPPERDDAVSDTAQTEEWKFSLDDLADDEAESDKGNIAGTLDRDQPLEPGDINLENAFFVVVGILIVVGLIAGAVFGF